MFMVCLTDTAATEIYTYSHTRALHNDLPIWRRDVSGQDRRAGRYRVALRAPAASLHGGAPVGGPGARSAQRAQADRSEEHTSEPQSLMRISYAVFCLKKKTFPYISLDKKKLN